MSELNRQASLCPRGVSDRPVLDQNTHPAPSGLRLAQRLCALATRLALCGLLLALRLPLRLLPLARLSGVRRLDGGDLLPEPRAGRVVLRAARQALQVGLQASQLRVPIRRAATGCLLGAVLRRNHRTPRGRNCPGAPTHALTRGCPPLASLSYLILSYLASLV